MVLSFATFLLDVKRKLERPQVLKIAAIFIQRCAKQNIQVDSSRLMKYLYFIFALYASRTPSDVPSDVPAFNGAAIAAIAGPVYPSITNTYFLSFGGQPISQPLNDTEDNLSEFDAVLSKAVDDIVDIANDRSFTFLSSLSHRKPYDDARESSDDVHLIPTQAIMEYYRSPEGKKDLEELLNCQPK